MSENQWKCKNCGAMNADEAKACAKCEAAAEKVVPTKDFVDQVTEIYDKHMKKE